VDTLVAPPAATLLDAWDYGLTLAPGLRPLALLAAARPADVLSGLARLPVGRRDAALFSLREALFGAALSAVADCPACAQRVELSLRTSDLRVPEPGAAEALALQWGDYELHFALPNTLDLHWLSANGPSAGDAGRALLGRCLLSAAHAGAAVDVDDLPDEAVAAVAAAMAEADPQADVQLQLTCPACGHGWAAPFDIGAYLWAEVDVWARRTLLDVHTLASAYGWRQADVLALSPARREIYIGLARSAGGGEL
jgi:hypothetical protein